MVNIKPVINLSNKKLLVYTGKISYGLYCFHGFVISFVILLLKKTGLILPNIVSGFIFLLLTFLLATLSYYFIEKPFLNLKDKLRKV